MKKTILILMMLMATIVASAQYSEFTYSTECSAKLLHIDQGEGATIFYFTYTAPKDFSYVFINDETKIVMKNTRKSYKIKTSANIPTGHNDKNTTFIEDMGRSINFIMAFDSIPLNQPFDIIENNDKNGVNVFNYRNIVIDTSKKFERYDIESFLEETPVKMNETYYIDGTQYTAITYKGVTLTTNFVKTYDAGNVDQVVLDIVNNTGHAFDFIINNISVTGYRNDKSFAMDVISPERYEQRVYNRQYWDYTGKSYDAERIAKKASTFSWGSGKNKETVEIGPLQFLLEFGMKSKLYDYGEYLDQKRGELVNQYLKNNTIKSGECYGGHFNIKYKKTDYYILKMVIDGETYKIRVRTK